ncbi:hypothetical protein KR032_012153 [Drosophila birchii]|nr:hypothetical protein KR032_012153 [Drosophila birchii]
MSSDIVCFSKTCKKAVLSSDLTIGCWLCENILHAKCIGVNGRTVDDVRKNIGLRYCCDACRDVERKMMSFMRQTKGSFKELLSSFNKTHNIFLALDKQFNSLTLLNESPRRKKTATGVQQGDGSLQPAAGAQQQPPLTLPTTSESNPRILRSSVRKEAVSEGAVGLNVPPPISISSPTGAQILTPHSPVNLNLSPQELPANMGTSGTLSVPPQALIAIPPTKQIFVSRLSPGQTSEDVIAFIRGKVRAVNLKLKVEKFKFSYARDISSFKINVPKEFFGTICSTKFWPEYVVVKEYEA